MIRIIKNSKNKKFPAHDNNLLFTIYLLLDLNANLLLQKVYFLVNKYA